MRQLDPAERSEGHFLPDGHDETNCYQENNRQLMDVLTLNATRLLLVPKHLGLQMFLSQNKFIYYVFS